MIDTYQSSFSRADWHEYMLDIERAWTDTAKKWSDKELLDALNYYSDHRLRIRRALIWFGYDPHLCHDYIVNRKIDLILLNESVRREI